MHPQPFEQVHRRDERRKSSRTISIAPGTNLSSLPMISTYSPRHGSHAARMFRSSPTFLAWRRTDAYEQRSAKSAAISSVSGSVEKSSVMQISTTPEGRRSSSASRLCRHSPRASGRLNDGMAMLNSGSTTFVRDNAASRLDPAAVGSRTAILSTIVRRKPSPARVVRASASRRRASANNCSTPAAARAASPDSRTTSSDSRPD